MFRQTNVPSDECSVRGMFRSTNVLLDQFSVVESAFDESVVSPCMMLMSLSRSTHCDFKFLSYDVAVIVISLNNSFMVDVILGSMK